MKTTNTENFLSDIKAAVMVGQPLEIGAAGTAVGKQRLTIGRLQRLASGDPKTDWPNRLSAAYSFFQQTGSTAGVLNALSVRPASDRWMRRVLKRASWYLLLLVLTMLLGLMIFLRYSNPYFEGLRSDLQLMTPSKFVPEVDPTAWVSTVLWCTAIFGILVFVWTILGGPKAAVRWCGGRSVSKLQQSSVALEAIERLHQSGLSMKEAIELSCDLVAADAATRGQIESALKDATESSGLVAWADAMAEAARDQMTKIELWLPLLGVTVIGSVLATTYCLLIYWPIISMLNELSSTVNGL